MRYGCNESLSCNQRKASYASGLGACLVCSRFCSIRGLELCMHDCPCGWLSILQLQILYNKQYGKYVLLFHADTPKFSFPTVGVAMAGNVTGKLDSTQH